LVSSWQPAAAQVFVERTPPCTTLSGIRKIGWMQFWK
jgi:hypothetical protein